MAVKNSIVYAMLRGIAQAKTPTAPFGRCRRYDGEI